jgi:hypothetical protein
MASFPGSRARQLKVSSATIAALACVGLFPAGSGAAQIPVSYPCGVVPKADIVSALGKKLGSVTPTEASVPKASTCAYGGEDLTISVGTTAIANPAAPLKVTKVAGLPNGNYWTYRGSTQTQLSFLVGSAASGTYVVIRNFVKVPRPKLEKIAKAFYAGMSSGQAGIGAATTTPSQLVPGG